MQRGSDARYDWIDDAFDDSKQDPLASRGMTGCSCLSVLIAGIGVAAILALVAYLALLAFDLPALKA